MKFLDREYHSEERAPFKFTFFSWFEMILGRTLENKVTKEEIDSRVPQFSSNEIRSWLDIYQAIKFDELPQELADTITKTIADIPKIYDGNDESREAYNVSCRGNVFISLVLAFYANYQNKSGVQENEHKKWGNACVSVEVDGKYIPIYSLYEWIKRECICKNGEIFLKQLGAYSSITAEIVRNKHISVVFDECFNDLIFVATENSHTVTGIYIVSLANGKYRCQYDTEDLCLIAFSQFSKWMNGIEPLIDINEVSTKASMLCNLVHNQSLFKKLYEKISKPTQELQKFYAVIMELFQTIDAIGKPNNPSNLSEKIALMAMIAIHLTYGDISQFPSVVWHGIADELGQNSRKLRNEYPDLELPIYIASSNEREIKLSEVRDNIENTIVSLMAE